MLRETKKQNEILSILEGCLKASEQFTIESIDQSITSIGKLVSIDSKDNMITFKCDTGVQLDKVGKVLLKVDGKEVSFMARSINCAKDSWTLCLPEKLNYKDRRKRERKVIRESDRSSIELGYISKVDKKQYKVISQLIDISETGARLVVTRETLQVIDISKVFKIISMDQDVAIKSNRAVISNAGKYKKVSMGLEEMFSIGIMFI